MVFFWQISTHGMFLHGKHSWLFHECVKVPYYAEALPRIMDGGLLSLSIHSSILFLAFFGGEHWWRFCTRLKYFPWCVQADKNCDIGDIVLQFIKLLQHQYPSPIHELLLYIYN